MRSLGLGVALSSLVAFSAAGSPGRVGITAAAPHIIIVHGPSLPTPIVIANSKDNHWLLLVREERRVEGPRPALDLALFWHPKWRSYAESPEKLRSLRPDQADQVGRLFPATAGLPMMISVGATKGVVSDSGLAVLRRYRVPTGSATKS